MKMRREMKYEKDREGKGRRKRIIMRKKEKMKK
jgi:hypothetical protein